MSPTLDAVVGAHLETKRHLQLAMQMIESVASGEEGLRCFWFAYSAPAEHRARFDMLLTLKLQRLKPSFGWKILGVDGHESQFTNINRAITAMAADPPDAVLTGDADDLWGPTRAARVKPCIEEGAFAHGCGAMLIENHVAVVDCHQSKARLNTFNYRKELANNATGIDSPSVVDKLLRSGDASIKGESEQVEHYEWLYEYSWLRDKLAKLDLTDLYTDMKLVQDAIYTNMLHKRPTFSFADTDSKWSYFWRPSSGKTGPSHVSLVGPAARAPEHVIVTARKILRLMQHLKATPRSRWADYDPDAAFLHAISTMHRQTRMQLAIPRWTTAERSPNELLDILDCTCPSHQTIVNGEHRILPTSLLMAICCAKDFREFDVFSNDDWGQFVHSVDTTEYAEFTDRSVALLAKCVREQL
jgi:hypothetical protein